MSDFLTEWFKGFEKGINDLEPKEQEKLFYQCGSNCVNTGAKKLYEKLYLDSGSSLDEFFLRLNEIESVAGYIIKPKEIYEISFISCVCKLHTLGYIHSDCICECSRQSIIYIMKSLEPNINVQVDKISTILGGDKECRFRITMI